MSDFFETRQGICKVMPELASKFIPLVRTLDPDINRVVKEFASYFKPRRVETYPDDGWKSKAEGNDFPDSMGAVVENQLTSCTLKKEPIIGRPFLLDFTQTSNRVFP